MRARFVSAVEAHDSIAILMLRRLQDRKAQYLATLVAITGVTLVRMALDPVLGRASYSLYFPLLGLVAWAFDRGPAWLGAALCWLYGWYVATPPLLAVLDKEPGAAPGFAVFVVSTAALTMLARAAAGTRHTAVLALQQSERSYVERERLAAIVESSDDAIIAKDLDGYIQSWNAAAERLFGYTAQEIVGKSILTLIPPERRFEEDHILMRLRRGERIDHFETIRVTKDGRALDISLTVSPIRNAAGEVVGASKIARDITERRRAERAIAEQREWFRVTLASIGDAVITTDRDGAITYMNAGAERLTGATLDEDKGKPLASVLRVMNEAKRTAVGDPYRNAMRSGKVAGAAHGTLLIRRDGLEYPIEDSASPIVDDHGVTIGLVIAFHDVSERRRAEAALAEQREWFETTLVSIGDAVIATDIQGRVMFMNPVAEHMTGWSLSDARGRDCNDVFNIVNEYTRKVTENPVGRVLRDGRVVGLANHTMLISRAGTEHPIDDSAAPIRGQDGRVTGAVLVFHDITERRRAERERQTAEKERESLLRSERAARSEAERANRLKDQFVATVSHELRTPLNAILGWTDLLKRKSSDPDTLARGLAVIDRNVRIQAQLVSDLLDVSRIASGKLKLELQLVDLGHVVEEAMETVRPAAEAKKLRLEFDLDRTLEPLVGDPARLQQVFWNLLSNAAKFTPEGGEIRLTVERGEGWATVTVADSGIGVSADFLPHIFERFRQADSSTTRRFGGLGLGLTIVRQLVELHGGTISAHSEGQGKGTSFTVKLPLEAVAADMGSEERRSLSPASAAAIAATLRELRVLLVEDEPEARELVERLLSEAGCRVVAVASARQGYEALGGGAHDLLISDIGLPEEDGYSLLQRIRADPRSDVAGLPAIALTAFARGEDRKRALRAGFQAHLPKPVDPAELLTTVASFANLVVGRRKPAG